MGVPKKPEFYRLLRERGLFITDLGKAAGVGQSHLSQVINDYWGPAAKPNRGKHTRIKLFPWLTREEIDALGWTEEFVRWLVGKDDKKPPQRFVHTLEGSFPEEPLHTNGEVKCP